MAYTPLKIDSEAVNIAVGACLSTMVNDICTKHVENAKREIGEKLPEEAGRILAKLIQEVPEGHSIVPHYSLNIYQKPTTKE